MLTLNTKYFNPRIAGTLLLSLWLSFFCVFSSAGLLAQSGKDLLHTWQEKAQPDTVRLAALLAYADTLTQAGLLDSALVTYERLYAFAAAQSLAAWKLEARYEQTLLSLKYNLDQPDDEARYQEAIIIAQQLQRELTLAKLYANRGTWYSRQDQTTQAMEDYLRSYSLVDGRTDSLTTRQLGITAIRLGTVYNSLGDTTQAIQYFQQAIAAAQRYGYGFIEGSALTNLGTIYWASQQVDKADYYWSKAYAKNKAANAHSNLMTAAYNLSMVRFSQGKNTEGVALLEESVALAKAFNNVPLLIFAKRQIGGNYFAEGNNRKGVALHREALAEAEKGAYVEQVSAISFELYQHFEKTGNYQQALQYYQRYQTAQDSLKSEEEQREIYRQESQYAYERQALADSLEFARKELLTQKTVRNQRQGLVVALLALLLLTAVAYSVYQARQRAQAEADRVKELDTFKSKFYTNITHEFRTPLTVILGMNRQIREQPDQYLKEGTTLIERNGNNLLRQINQILDLSKLEFSTINLHPVRKDFIEFVQYAVMSFHSTANQHNLALRFFSPHEQLPATFDLDAVQKIVHNLVSNAIKFTPSGGAVKVSVQKAQKGVEIRVKDSGQGIPATELPHIFDRYYQATSSAETPTVGSGIGLAYVKELVNLLTGNISVDSQVGVGTVFTVYLPMPLHAPTTVPPAPISAVTPVIPEPTLSKSPSRTIVDSNLPQLLIIDDNADVIAYLKSCLAEHYHLDVAYNGRIGIEKAIHDIPDLILTDIMMPEVDGYEVCAALKNDDHTSHIPIIMLTAKADTSSKIAGLQRGADAYLIKPFDKEELLIRVAKMLERQRRLAAHFTNASTTATADLESAVLERENAFLRKVRTVLADHYADEDFGLPQLCAAIGMSRSQLFRKMKALLDESPSAFIRNYRLEKAQALLVTGEWNVSEVAWQTGFSNLAHFSKVYKEKFGESPSATGK
ncbi:MAG: ATP-binding protein [Bacteroidota bacterium]